MFFKYLYIFRNLATPFSHAVKNSYIKKKEEKIEKNEELSLLPNDYEISVIKLTDSKI